MTERVVVIMGSGSDEDFAKSIWSTLEKYNITCDRRVISAHKRPAALLELLEQYEKSNDNIVYITIAGRSNALSGVVDCNTKYAVIACPPYSEKFGGADIYSSLRMPGGVAPLVVLEPENAAYAAIKILSYSNSALKDAVSEHQKTMKEKNVADDEKIRKS